jgi:hypothetical protein
LEWFLLTNVLVERAAEARLVIGYYECRWVVEEYPALSEKPAN